MATEPNSIYLSAFFSAADVVIERTVPSAFHLVQTLVGRLAANHFPGVDPAPIVEAVLRRERASQTVVGEGVALPHARIEGLSRPYLALGVYPAGVPVAEGEAPVRLVFLLLVPESQPARYLQILRALAGLLREPGMTERLAGAASGEEVMRLLQRSERRLPDYICAGDLMDAEPARLRAAEPLSAALEAFMAGEQAELPIVDEEGRLVGAVDSRALLGTFIPTGLRALFPALQRAPAPTCGALAERLREAHRTRVCEAMNTDVCTCSPETPAREVAADLAERNVTRCYVLDAGRRLVGVVTLAGFFRRILKD